VRSVVVLTSVLASAACSSSTMGGSPRSELTSKGASLLAGAAKVMQSTRSASVPSEAVTRASEQGVHLQLILDRTRATVGGTPLTGQIVVFNNSGHPIQISNACNGWVAVGLTNRHVTFEPLNGLVGCKAEFLPVGTSHHKISIQTTYSRCLQPGGTSNKPHAAPPCAGPRHDQLPPLPAGRYQTATTLWGVSKSIEPPASVAITLSPG
jgi:hypothetical protein